MSTKPTIADIAKELRVSPSTVSRALRNHPAISERRKVEVRAAAEALGFEVRDPVFTQIQTSPKLVGCVVPSVSHPYFSLVLEKLEAVCTQNGCDLIIANSSGSNALEHTIVQRLATRGVEGVFFVPATDDSSALDVCARLVPTVVLTKQREGYPSIGVSHEAGGRQVAEHFQELGRRAALLVGPKNDAKFQGFRSFFEEARVSGFRMDFFDVGIGGWDGHLSLETHRALLAHFSEGSIRNYDCVYAFNDLAAAGVLHALADFGRDVPRDVAVCGFDDTPLARELRPGLTSVAQPVGQIVRSGFHLLERILADESIPLSERSFSLTPHLVVRGSTFAGP